MNSFIIGGFGQRAGLLTGMLFMVSYTTRAQTTPGRYEIVRGIVTADSNRALPWATFIVTLTSSGQSQITSTGADDSYITDWPPGTGEFVVRVDAKGFVAVNKRVARAGTNSVIVAEVKLARESAAQTLAAVVPSPPSHNQCEIR